MRTTRFSDSGGTVTETPSPPNLDEDPLDPMETP